MGAIRQGLGFARSLWMYYGSPLRARRTRRLYGQFIRPGDLCFDIGAHVGNRTRCWASLGARVIAVEPQPMFAGFLRRLFRKSPAVVVEEAAIGDAPGVMTLHVSSRTPTVTTTSPEWIGQVRQDQSFSWVVWDTTTTVPAVTLDMLIARHGVPQFCKIDVEGSEADVLRGLSTAIPALSIEYIPAARDVAIACVDMLERLGPYRFNVSRSETMQMLFDNGVDATSMRTWLAGQQLGDGSGDIYARLPES